MSGAKRKDEERSEDILARVARDSETLGTSSMARALSWAGRFLSVADAPGADPVEVWGKRIGRVIGLLLALYLLFALVGQVSGR